MARVTIGMPVYNGERYLAAAVACLQAQTHADFELLIADNASTDSTEAICRDLMKRDDRISYHRHERNLGWARNFNFVLDRCEGKFFKWAACDDRVDPDFLRACLQVLEDRPECVASFCRVVCIDDQDREAERLDSWQLRPGLSPHDRVRWAIWTQYLNEPFGIFRADALKACARMSGFISTDRVMIAEVFLRGDLALVDRYLFLRRTHEGSYSTYWNDKPPRERWASIDPDARWPLRLMWLPRIMAYMRAIRRAPIPWTEKLACAGAVFERPLWKLILKCTGAPRPRFVTRILGVGAPPDSPTVASAPAES